MSNFLPGGDIAEGEFLGDLFGAAAAGGEAGVPTLLPAGAAAQAPMLIRRG